MKHNSMIPSMRPLPLLLPLPLPLLLPLLVLCSPQVAHASPFESGEDQAISLDNDFIVPQRSEALPRDTAPIGNNPYRHTIFLNFDGATLTMGGNDSATNQTDLIELPQLDYPAMTWDNLGGKAAGQRALVNELKILYMEYAVEFVTERPSTGEYTMAMVGGKGENCKAEEFAVGIAPLDCKNTKKNDICLIYGEKLSSIKKLAFVIAHELGHTFGLEHINTPEGIMYPALTNETQAWASGEVSPPSACTREEQDSSKVLYENLGAGPGDQVAPLVWFVRPGQEALLPPNFSFEVAVADDLKIHHVILYVDGAQKLELTQPPFAASLTKMTAGKHLIKAEAFDWKPNKTVVEMTVTIDPQCIESGLCSQGKANLNQPCRSGADCSSGYCALDSANQGLTGRCTTVCEEQNLFCPADLTCQPQQQQWICLPDTQWSFDSIYQEDTSGGCALTDPNHAASGTSARGGVLGLSLLVLLALIGRRVRS